LLTLLSFSVKMTVSPRAVAAALRPAHGYGAASGQPKEAGHERRELEPLGGGQRNSRDSFESGGD
jgi:hypothetical protein